jgi:hypothetical protein
MRQSLQRHHNNQSVGGLDSVSLESMAIKPAFASPIRVFAIGIEHALGVPIER